MNEVKTTLRRMAFYYLLFAINIIPCANFIPDVFPLRNASTVYLLALSVCLVLYYAHRVSPGEGLSVMMIGFSLMGLLLILLRGIKYSAFSEVGVLARHTWYLYYLPMLLLPLFLLNIALLVAGKKTARITAVRILTLAVTVIFIALILTNDLHGQVFIFRPGFENWDGDYSRGWLFYVAAVWQYGMYFAAIVILVIKCRVGGMKKYAPIILIPALIGAVMFALLFTGNMPRLNGTPIAEFPETMIFTAAAVLECCMGLGLIPTNNDYGKLFRHLSISAQITDMKGTVMYSSPTASPLTPEQFKVSGETRIGEHTLLHRMPLPGGFGFWQDDMTERDRLNDELAEAKERLSEETELIRLRGELKEKRMKIEQRTLLYDGIARRTRRQSQLISRLAADARLSNDPALKDHHRRRIAQLGAYIKRYANLTLLSGEREDIEAGELGLSVSEVLRYLNYRGIPGEMICTADRPVPAMSAITVFEAFETLLEIGDTCLKGVFVNLSSGEHVTFKATFEGLCTPLPAETRELLAQARVAADIQIEDEIAYVCFTLRGRGESV